MKYKDPNDPLNGKKYHTGKCCIEKDCPNPAGTVWSPLWCQKHNSERMDRISASLDELKKKMEATGEKNVPKM